MPEVAADACKMSNRWKKRPKLRRLNETEKTVHVCVPEHLRAPVHVHHRGEFEWGHRPWLVCPKINNKPSNSTPPARKLRHGRLVAC